MDYRTGALESVTRTLQPRYESERRTGYLDNEHYPDDHQHVGEHLPRRSATLFGVDAHPYSVLAGDAANGGRWCQWWYVVDVMICGICDDSAQEGVLLPEHP